MNTENKVHVGERDVNPTKTVSGGVLEPADPAHYPLLTDNESPRALSRLTDSFKDRVLSESAETAAHSGPGGASGRRTAAPRSSHESLTTSPRLSAGRADLRLVPESSPKGQIRPTQGQVAGQEHKVGQIWVCSVASYILFARPFLHILLCCCNTHHADATRSMLCFCFFAAQESRDNEQEGESWGPVSPRKHVSLRRRTADDQADKKAKEGTLYDIPAHANSFATLEEEAREDELVHSLCNDTQEEEGNGYVSQGSCQGIGTR